MMTTNKRCGVVGSIPSTAGQWCKSIPLNYYFLNLKLIEENGTETRNADNRHTQFNDLSPTAEVVWVVYDSVRSVSEQDNRGTVVRWRAMLRLAHPLHQAGRTLLRARTLRMHTQGQAYRCLGAVGQTDTPPWTTCLCASDSRRPKQTKP